MKPRYEPIIKQPALPPDTPEDRAAVLFIHGFGDDGPSFEQAGDFFRGMNKTAIVTQIQSAGKLPHVLWLLPTAPLNRDAMDTAWYTPTRLPAAPPPRPELADDEDEPGMLASLAYLEALVARLCGPEFAIPAGRVVVAGFSQGGVLALLMALLSRFHADGDEVKDEEREGAEKDGIPGASSATDAHPATQQLAGYIGLMSYLGLGAERLAELRAERGLSADDDGNKTTATTTATTAPPILLMRGGLDRLVPRRYWTGMLEGLLELGVPQARLRLVERQGLGHAIDAAVLGEMCAFIEEVVPGPKGAETG